MSYTVTLDPQNGLIRVDYVGTTTITDRLAAMRDGTQLLQQSGYQRVLVDMTQASTRLEPLSRSNSFTTAMALATPMHGCRLAYVIPLHAYGNRMIENLASARHAALERFDSVEAATRWLLAHDEMQAQG